MKDGSNTVHDRDVLQVNGADAETFLDSLITCQVVGLNEGDTRFGALLTPQGKIMFDFFLIKAAEGLLIDIDAILASEFQKRLIFYRLRAKVDIETRSDLHLSAVGPEPDENATISIQDPRHPHLGWRNYGNANMSSISDGWLKKRIELGIPQGGFDFDYGDAYPHETLMDQFGGIDFKKGCYVG